MSELWSYAAKEYLCAVHQVGLWCTKLPFIYKSHRSGYQRYKTEKMNENSCDFCEFLLVNPLLSNYGFPPIFLTKFRAMNNFPKKNESSSTEQRLRLLISVGVFRFSQL